MMNQGSSRNNLKIFKGTPIEIKRPLKRILPKLPFVLSDSVLQIPQQDVEETVKAQFCYICDCELTRGVRLVNKGCAYPNVGLPAKIVELMGDSFVVIANEDDLICQKCHGMFLQVERIERELKHLKKILRDHLLKKYGIEENSFTNEAGKAEGSNPEEKESGYKPLAEDFVSFPTKSKTKHLNETRHHRNNSQSCTMCEFVCDSVRALRTHKMNVHLTNWTCHFCNKVFVNESCFTEHTKLHLTEPSQSHLSQTQAQPQPQPPPQEAPTNDSNTQPLFTCTLCDVQFLEECYYNEHLQSHEALNSLDLGPLEKNQLTLEAFEPKLESVDLLDMNIFANAEPSIDMKRFVCATCGSEHETLDELNNHFDAEHEMKQCSLCPQIVGTKELVDAHVLQVHGNGNPNEMDIHEMVCTQCDEKAQTEDTIVHKPGCIVKSLMCAQCGAIAESEEILAMHLEVCNVQSVTNKEEEDQNQDADNQQTKSPNEKKQRAITCAACGQVFANKSELASHEEDFPDHLIISCPDCDLTFARESFLNEHRAKYHKECHCRHCNKPFSNIKQLKAHERRHIRAARESFQCSQCHRVFQTPTGLRHHMSVHTGDYKYKCEFCGKGFVSRVRSEEHRACHTKEERYACDICDRKFSVQASFWIHRKWHDNPKPYACSECGLRFKHTSLLSVHKRKHTGERPYSCQYCEQTFVVSNSLKRHMALHTGAFPHTCTICEIGFPEKHKLAQHMSKVHNDNELILEQMKNKTRNYKVAVEHPSENLKQELEETLILTDSSAQYLTIQTQEGERILLTESMLQENGENQLVEIVLQGDQQSMEIQ